MPRGGALCGSAREANPLLEHPPPRLKDWLDPGPQDQKPSLDTSRRHSMTNELVQVSGLLSKQVATATPLLGLSSLAFGGNRAWTILIGAVTLLFIA